MYQKKKKEKKLIQKILVSFLHNVFCYEIKWLMTFRFSGGMQWEHLPGVWPGHYPDGHVLRRTVTERGPASGHRPRLTSSQHVNHAYCIFCKSEADLSSPQTVYASSSVTTVRFPVNIQKYISKIYHSYAVVRTYRGQVLVLAHKPSVNH